MSTGANWAVFFIISCTNSTSAFVHLGPIVEAQPTEMWQVMCCSNQKDKSTLWQPLQELAGLGVKWKSAMLDNCQNQPKSIESWILYTDKAQHQNHLPNIVLLPLILPKLMWPIRALTRETNMLQALRGAQLVGPYFCPACPTDAHLEHDLGIMEANSTT